MGLFDELNVGVKCPSCGRAMVQQTKLTANPYLRTYRAGDVLDFGDELHIASGYFDEEQVCGLGKPLSEGCGAKFIVRITIENNKLTGEWSVLATAPHAEGE